MAHLVDPPQRGAQALRQLHHLRLGLREHHYPRLPAPIRFGLLPLLLRVVDRILRLREGVFRRLDGVLT
eukprot:1418937-Pyramimonas_sp.AAC.1